MTANKQLNLIEPETSWFHVFRQMIDSGDISKMGPYAVTVYLVVKSFTNWKTGKSFPSIDLITEKSGISKRQVISSLQKLEDLGYVTKERVGRVNNYKLREKIDFVDGEGRPAATASWDYLPSTVRDAVAELKKFRMTGSSEGLTVINIENLTLQIQQVFGGENISQNNMIDPNALPDGPVKRAWLASLKHRTDPE
jgi:DNA-binding transcriptional ArsR family regulator